MSHECDHDPPSPFIIRWATRLADRLEAPRRALDIAMGRGRHAIALAEAGCQVFGVDVKFDAVRAAVDRASAQALTVRGWCADLTQFPLPRETFQITVVTRYLQRDLFASIRDTVTPAGFVLYETFTVDQRALGVGPTGPDHLLQRGELAQRFSTFDVLFYEEVSAPEALARIVARKPQG